MTPTSTTSTSTVTVRPFREGDAAETAALWNRVFPDPAPRNFPDRIIRDKLRVQRELFFVAEIDEAIVGTAMAGFDGRRGWVYAVAVHPDHRRRGIGTALMTGIERELAARGCPKINLQVIPGNDDAVRFYERLGYAVEERVSMGKVMA